MFQLMLICYSYYDLLIKKAIFKQHYVQIKVKFLMACFYGYFFFSFLVE